MVNKQEQLSSQITTTEDVASWWIACTERIKDAHQYVLHFNISLFYECNLGLRKHSSYYLFLFKMQNNLIFLELYLKKYITVETIFFPKLYFSNKMLLYSSTWNTIVLVKLLHKSWIG